MSEAIEKPRTVDGDKLRADLAQIETQIRDLFETVKEHQQPFEEPRASLVSAIAHIQAAKFGARRF